MSRVQRLGAVLFAVSLLLVGVAPAAAGGTTAEGELSVTVEQSPSGEVTVRVTGNGSAVEGAEVTVAVDGNGTYAGTGTHTTGADGTVSLPAPEENVTVTVTASDGDAEASTTVTLVSSEGASNAAEAFGSDVSSYVQSLNDTEGPKGVLVASWVLANNPGDVPEHAGPPENGSAGNGSAGGPPEGAGPPDDSGGAPNGTGP